MRDPEKAIEAVFAGLRDTFAPPGMEQRVLKSVEAHEQSRFPQSWRQFLRPPAAVAGTFGCGVLLAGIAFFFHVPSTRQRTSRIPVLEKSSAMPLAVMTPPKVAEAHPLSAGTPIVRREKEGKLSRTPSTDNSADAIAMREMQAPSQVAPPLPLTAQERLLIRMTRSYSHEELAVLNPVKWAAKDAKEKEAFEKFFGQVPIKTGDKE